MSACALHRPSWLPAPGTAACALVKATRPSAFIVLHNRHILCLSAWQVLDEAYLQRYYKTPMGAKGRAWHDLELACMADTALQPFKTRSQDMRVITGQTALFYMVSRAGVLGCRLWTGGLCASAILLTVAGGGIEYELIKDGFS